MFGRNREEVGDWSWWRRWTGRKPRALRRAARHAVPALEALEARALLTPGAKDTTFGVGGITVSPLTTTSDTAKAVGIQSDGRTIVAGDVAGNTFNINTSSDFAIARYTVAGSLDTTFGITSGATYITFDVFDRVFDVIVQADDKIVVVGETNAFGGNSDMAILRLNANGTLDTTFGPEANGLLRVDFFGGNDGAQSVALDSLGRIVVAGFATTGGRLVGAVIRLNTDGSFDGNFNSTGRQTYFLGNQSDVATGVAINNVDQVLLAGNTLNNSVQTFHVIKFNPDGSLDTTFGFSGPGYSLVSAGIGEDYARGIVWMPIGRIVVGGYSRQSATNFDFFAARFNSEGILDTSFSDDGVALADFGANQDVSNSVVVQRDGHIVVGGSTTAGALTVFAMARWNVDGTLDSTFGTGGLVTQQVNGVNAAGLDLLVAPGDSQLLYFVGWAGSFVENRDFVIMRFETNRVFPQGNPNTIVRMYRAYNPNADYHFFTTSEFEFLNAVANGYRDESTGRGGFGVYAGQAAGSTPLYRLYNIANGRHYYTLDIIERDRLQTLGWTYEANEGFMFRTQVSGTSVIYRLYNTSSGTHLYTESAGVRNFILQSFNTWVAHDDLGFAFIQLPSASAFAESIAQSAAAAPATSTDASAGVASLVAIPATVGTGLPAPVLVPGSGPDDAAEEGAVAPRDDEESSADVDDVFASLEVWGD